MARFAVFALVALSTILSIDPVLSNTLVFAINRSKSIFILHFSKIEFVRLFVNSVNLTLLTLRH